MERLHALLALPLRARCAGRGLLLAAAASGSTIAAAAAFVCARDGLSKLASEGLLLPLLLSASSLSCLGMMTSDGRAMASSSSKVVLLPRARGWEESQSSDCSSLFLSSLILELASMASEEAIFSTGWWAVVRVMGRKHRSRAVHNPKASSFNGINSLRHRFRGKENGCILQTTLEGCTFTWHRCKQAKYMH